MTPTYKGLNKNGRGRRAWRKKYDQFDIVGQVPADSSLLICECGNSKSRTANVCKDCYAIERQKVDYPPLDEIIVGVLKTNMSAYAESIGKLDNAVRKHLLRNGIEKERFANLKKAFCQCGVELSREDVSSQKKSCPEHRKEQFDYPPLEELVEGVQTYGMTEYSRMIGLKYASNLRKHLQRRGFEFAKAKGKL